MKDRILCKRILNVTDGWQVVSLFIKFLLVMSGIAFILWLVTPGKIKLKEGGELVFVSTPTVIDNTVCYWGWIYRTKINRFGDVYWCYTPINKKRFKRYLNKAK